MIIYVIFQMSGFAACIQESKKFPVFIGTGFGVFIYLNFVTDMAGRFCTNQCYNGPI